MVNVPPLVQEVGVMEKYTRVIILPIVDREGMVKIFVYSEQMVLAATFLG
jgi:hypothetical protein